MRNWPPTFEHYRDQELTVESLADAAGRLARRLDLKPDDGRVADRVEARGIRYYQTLGVLDKPLRYDGRRAVYGYRHLLQLLAVRKLQQEGHPLQVIQQALAGRSTDMLERALAAAAGGRAAPMTELRLKPDPARVRRPEASDGGQAEGGESCPGRSSGDMPNAARRLVAAQLAPGVTLTIDPSVVDDADRVLAAVEQVLAKVKAGPERN